MKLLRLGPSGGETPAALDDDGLLRDLTTLTEDVDGSLLTDQARMVAVRRELAARSLPVLRDPGRVGVPVARPGKIVGIGLNYRDHAADIGAEVPPEPIVFLKATSTLVGPADDLVLPKDATSVDWEVELAVVMGQPLHDCSDPVVALAAVGGYASSNDVTERSHVQRGPTWVKGKCHDTFTPLGPWLVTPDEAGDVGDLELKLWVNGTLRQSSSTAEMAVPVADLLCHLSRFMTLEPGDVVLTGTPGGVAAVQPDPKPFLGEGDVLELEIAGLGRQRNQVVARQRSSRAALP